MKNIKKAAFILTTLCTLSSVYAGDLTVDNRTGEDIQVFVRGKDAKSHDRLLIQKNNTVTVDTSNFKTLENYSVYEAIASSSRNGDDPDWKLLTGECTNLDKDGAQKLIITKTGLGLKISCEVVNPGS